MERPDIKRKLIDSHQTFTKYIDGLTHDAFHHRPQGKWTAGQQLEHIYLSVRPVTLAFSLPKFLLRMIFGKANRPSRTYDQLVARYHERLSGGGKASKPFIPREVPIKRKQKIINALNSKVSSLCAKFDNFSDRDLDTLILPHPLLGKLTMREMLYFTIYHVGHHHNQTQKNLKSVVLQNSQT